MRPLHDILTRAAATALAACAALPAQDLTVTAPPQSHRIAIVGATVHTMAPGATPMRGATVVFDAGRIVAIEKAGTPTPAGTKRFDGRGLQLWPGLISANTTIGLNEIGSLPDTQDANEKGEVTPEVKAAVAVNPDSTVIPVTRTNGILTVGVLPRGGLVPGRASVVQLEGWTWEDMAVTEDAGLVVQWPSLPTRGRESGRGRRGRGGDDAPESSGPEQQRQRIDELFLAARAYLEARSHDDSVPTDLRFEAMRDVLTGRKPVFLAADGLEQVISSVTWAKDLGMRPVLIGGAEADLALDFLVRHEVPVIVADIHRLPRRRDDPVEAPFTLPKRLHEAGVHFCISSNGGWSDERNLPYEVATAVAHGLPVEVGMAALTRNAADILGIGDEVGTIEPGKRATLILTDGHPLEITTNVVAAWIEGRRIDLSNKQTVLAEKYVEKYRQLELWPAEASGGGR